MATSSTRLQIYLGCGLSHSTDEFKAYIEQLRSELEKQAIVFKFRGFDPPLSEAFLWDTNCVRRSNVLVADFTYPSTGLGMECGIAIEQRKPIIALADDATAAERILPFGNQDPLFFSLRYKNHKEATTFVLTTLVELFPEHYAGL